MQPIYYAANGEISCTLSLLFGRGGAEQLLRLGGAAVTGQTQKEVGRLAGREGGTEQRGAEGKRREAVSGRIESGFLPSSRSRATERTLLFRDSRPISEIASSISSGVPCGRRSGVSGIFPLSW
jgi:hypothetical protein